MLLNMCEVSPPVVPVAKKQTLWPHIHGFYQSNDALDTGHFP